MSQSQPQARASRAATPLPERSDPRSTAEVLRIVDQLCGETHAAVAPARLDSSLDRDLGLDSLARVELLARIERQFKIHLPDDSLSTVETPADLLQALRGAGARPGPAAQASAAAIVPEFASLPTRATTLIEVLEWHVAAQPDRAQVVFLAGDRESKTMSHADLLREAGLVAGGLAKEGLAPGAAVAIMLPSGLEFFHAFFGVLLAGGVPVPLYPPAHLSRIEDHLRRQAGILASCRAPLLVTVPEARSLARLLEFGSASRLRARTVAELRAPATAPAATVRGDATALLQYTSGSTGNPKGVVLSHANLLANIRAWSTVTRLSPADVCVSWLPLYHDMGLIGAWLGSLYNACPLVLMSPLDFLARPVRWLRALHEHRGTVSAAPNFAYELCVRRIDEAELEGLDLSRWRLAANGAEAVSADTIARFCARFAGCGFRREAMTPVYGLAESTVGLAVPPIGRGPRIERVCRERLQREGYAAPAAPDDPHAQRVVACGRALPGHEMRIADEGGRELPERHLGRLQFRGPSATSGYFANPAETQRLIHRGWLDSGDIAFLADAEVFITSRAKDLIIKGGRNLHPYELEDAIGALPGVRRGCVAIFGARDPVGETERLVAVVETREQDQEALRLLRRQANQLAVDLLGTPLDELVAAAPHSILKTSSGKIRRAATRDLYTAGQLARRGRSVPLQVLRLALAAGRSRLVRAARGLAAAGYGALAWSAFMVVALLLWPLVAGLQRPATGWRLAHIGARTLLRLLAAPVDIRGREHLPEEAPFVAVSNHASYVDGIVLAAALRRPVSFVAKRELAGQAIAGRFLRGLGAIFVERFMPSRSVEDTRRLVSCAQAGRPLFFFPEGTFTRASGLRPFRMGAFLVAAEGGLPLLPIAIRGTRAVLRDESWLPRRGPVVITIGPPIPPPGSDWAAAQALRAAARAGILEHCGETDLASESPAAEARE